VTRTLLDTGPLVSYLIKGDQWHEWAVAQLSALTPPLITCEPVLAEACFVVRRHGGRPEWVLQLLLSGLFEVGFDLDKEATALTSLISRYNDVPMSLADACLVRMAELHAEVQVLTLDRDFQRYRRNGRQVIPCLAPWQRK
jgi:predicted nucleic acid-binding protein